MRCLFILLLALVGCATVPAGESKPVKIKKVLVHLLDHDGKHYLSPSLYERDAYQAQLRQNRAEQGGLRFDIHCSIHEPRALTVQVEMRGANDKQATEMRLSKLVLAPRAGTQWAALSTEAESFRAFGQLTAWRVTVWDGDSLLAEQPSFLW